MRKVLILIFGLATLVTASAQPFSREGFINGVCTDDGDVDTLETICTVWTAGYRSIVFQGTVATAAFTDFDVALGVGGTGFASCATANYVTYYTASADYTSPSGYLHSASADPTTWTTTEISLKLDGLQGVGCIRLQAAGTSSDPAITWRLQ